MTSRTVNLLWGLLVRKLRTYSQYSQDAATLLGAQIKLGRKQRRWSEQELAERAGISRATLQKIENGSMTSAIGLVFEVATLVGIPLFESSQTRMSKLIEQTQDKVALLPKRIRAEKEDVYDDF